MRFATAAALFAGAAVAAPSPAIAVPTTPNAQDVKILGITAIGSGCPAGHAYVTIDATGTIFDVAFDQYYASVGPGNVPADARKNCRLSINMEFKEGLQ